MTGTSEFDRCRERVKEMTDAGESIGGIEEMLAAAPLGNDERDALWLLAWTRVQRHRPARPGPAPRDDHVRSR